MGASSQDRGPGIEKRLRPVYLFHGVEPLLVDDEARQLRLAIREKGYDERIVFQVEAGFDWDAFSGEFVSLSLFSQKKLIEFWLPTAKPVSRGAEILSGLAQQPAEDVVLLVLCDKLETGVKKSRWFKRIQEHGHVIEHYAVAPSRLPGWVRERAQGYQLKIDLDACRLLAYFLEGNLLAIDQELRKFAITGSPGLITAEEVRKNVEDGARFNTFGYLDAVLSGDLKRALRILASLRAEGVPPVLVNWAFARETRNLLEMSARVGSGKSISAVMKQQRIWSSRSRIVEAALKRISLPRWQDFHRTVARLDRLAKGRESARSQADIWTEYERLTLAMCRTR